MPADDGDGWEFETSDVDAETDEESDQSNDEWRFSVEEVGDDAATTENGEGEQSAVGGNVFGSYDSDTEEIEPGSPTAENSFFVVVGALLALFVFVQFYLLVA